VLTKTRAAQVVLMQFLLLSGPDLVSEGIGLVM
jgi:hypothetical protein